MKDLKLVKHDSFKQVVLPPVFLLNFYHGEQNVDICVRICYNIYVGYRSVSETINVINKGEDGLCLIVLVQS